MSRVDETKELDSRFVINPHFFVRLNMFCGGGISFVKIDIFNLLLVVYRLLLLASTMAVPE
jgi:hypothetical protein